MKDSLQWGFARAFEFLGNQSLYWKHKELLKRGLLCVGRHTYGIPDIRVYKGSEKRVVIGSFCSIGEGVTMLTGGIHPVNWISTFPFRIKWNLPGAYQDGMPTSDGDILIGSDVWIGSNATILSGVTIGSGSIIGAGAVLTRSVPPYAIVAGVPAKVIGARFGDDVIKELLEIKWWEWDDKKIGRYVDLLCSERVEEFIASARTASE